MRAVLLCFFVAATFCGLAAADVACDAAANQARPPCVDGETCCGAGTMTPSCIPAGSDKQCCRHFLSSTQCNATQSCCGMMGSGASSYAYCCDEGSTCCKSSGSGTGTSACCAAGSQCCNAPNGGYCCRADQVCNLNMMSCDDAAPPAYSTTAAPAYSSQPAEVTTAAPPAANCLAWSSTTGATCSEAEDCCGAGTMFPQCIAKDSGKQCCTWFKAATTCNASQSCCGMMGPGASSSAFCCNEGSTCCHASSSTSGTSTCCPAGSTCCAGSSIGLCCGADEVCNSGMNRCDKVTPAPYGSQPAEVTTAAPTPAPYSSQPAEITTAAPYAQPTAAPYSSQSAEITTEAPTTAAPYVQPTTTAAPYTPPTTAAPAYTTSQPSEVTTKAPTTAAPYGSQPAEVTTASPSTYNPTPAPAWDTYSPALGQTSWTPVLVSFVAVVVLAVVFQ